VAFPAISTGVYRYPPDEAAEIAVGTVAEVLAGTDAIAAVVFCCFSEESAGHHRRALEALR
jgi:O-acetyl-ADP-ribose deacetylase (regulator of RNase III)